MSELQICHCGWSKMTTYRGLRIHQGKMGCTPRIPRRPQLLLDELLPSFNLLRSQAPLEEAFRERYIPSVGDQMHYPAQLVLTGARTPRTILGCLPDSGSNQTIVNPSLEEPGTLDSGQISPVIPESASNPRNSMNTQAAGVAPLLRRLIQLEHCLRENPTTAEERTTSFPSSPQIWRISETFDQELPIPVAEEAPSIAPCFETPSRTLQSGATLENVRRALEFPAEEQQVEVVASESPRTNGKAAAEKKKKVVEKREAKQLKLKCARDRAVLQQGIHMREQRVAEVLLSIEAFMGKLDDECNEIDAIFSELMEVVEDARQKALQPLKLRKQKVEKDGQEVIQKIEEEIEELQKKLDKLALNPDSQTSAPTTLDHEGFVDVDTSLAFGTLRATIVAMMEEIQESLDKLSSFELGRIQAFQVDVKLDPSTAHRCLVLSDDGKEVDSSQAFQVSDSPARFDLHASVLGVNRLTSGRFYWEVEVKDRKGWDLGVALRGANRRGRLSLNPSGGFWAIVHYEGEKYAALTDPPVSLALRARPQKVGVFVDYKQGVVSFYDTMADRHIYSFTRCSFGGEIKPYFSPHLRRDENNAQPLVISAVRAPERSS